MKNFMGTPEASLEAHPVFNLILGPNGAGKSSFMNAIRVGLSTKNDFPPGKRIDSFLRNGSSEGFTSIYIVERDSTAQQLRRSLSGAKTAPLTVCFTRTLRLDTSVASEYRINGKRVTATEYRERVESYDIDTSSLL